MSKRQKFSKISDFLLWCVIYTLVILASIAIPLLSAGDYVFEWDKEARMDATMVNGILTADATIFVDEEVRGEIERICLYTS